MKHVFGMAKSHLDNNGAKPRGLELDFLRMLYAVEHHRRLGDSAHGYLAVLSAAVAQRVRAWLQKYDAHTCVTCVTCVLQPDELEALRSEKHRNDEGARRGIASDHDMRTASDSIAELGRNFGERELRAAIRRAEPLVHESPLRGKDLPFGVHWDFYGTVADS